MMSLYERFNASLNDPQRQVMILLRTHELAELSGANSEFDLYAGVGSEDHPQRGHL